jgi:hypothetical protein
MAIKMSHKLEMIMKFCTNRLIRLLGGISLSCASGVLHANVIYTYTGNPYTYINGGYGVVVGDLISGQIELTSNLAPNLTAYNATSGIVGYSFSDGVNIIDGTTTSAGFVVSTNASGAIIDWNFTAWNCNQIGIPQVETSYTLAGLSPCGTAPGTDIASLSFTAVIGKNERVPGTWSIGLAPIPEPSTYARMALGLGAVAWAARRRPSKASSSCAPVTYLSQVEPR